MNEFSLLPAVILFFGAGGVISTLDGDNPVEDRLERRVDVVHARDGGQVFVPEVDLPGVVIGQRGPGNNGSAS